MNLEGGSSQGVLLGIALVGLLTWAAPARAQPAKGRPAIDEIRIESLQGTAELLTKGAVRWVRTQTNQVLYPLDRLRLGPDSRALLRWSDQSAVRLEALTEIEILS